MVCIMNDTEGSACPVLGSNAPGDDLAATTGSGAALAAGGRTGTLNLATGKGSVDTTTSAIAISNRRALRLPGNGYSPASIVLALRADLLWRRGSQSDPLRYRLALVTAVYSLPALS